MDKETLSNYGWIVIVVIILVILMGLATPFGNYVRDGVTNIMDEFSKAGNVNIESIDGSVDSGDAGENTESTGIAPGVYASRDDLTTPKVTWEELVEADTFIFDGTTLCVNIDQTTYYPVQRDLLDGYLVLPSDGSVTKLGNTQLSGYDYYGYPGFYCCDKLTGILIPDTVEELTGGAFYGCENLEHITIGGGIKELVDFGIANYNSITEIVINEGVEIIGEEAISYCKGLKTITIPSTITSLHHKGLKRNTALTDIYYNGTKDQWDAFFAEEEFWCPNDLTLHCNDGTTYFLRASAT